MHTDPWKLELLLFVLTWWPAIGLTVLGLTGYGIHRIANRSRP